MASTSLAPALTGMFMFFITTFWLVYPAQAAPAGPRYFSIIAENDIYVPRGQDRHYTNGVRLAVGLQSDRRRPWYSWLGTFTAADSFNAKQRYELALGQNIYTPERYATSTPIPTDRPYAGWLYSEMTVISEIAGSEQSFVINLGMVGPVALGEPAQKLIHSITGDRKPAGWDNQLGNEPTLLIRYRRSRFIPLGKSGPIKSDLVSRFGVNLGNVFTDAGIGVVMRIGNHLPEQDIPHRIQPGLSGGSSYIQVRPQQTDWMLFAEIQGRAIARNIFLDGNTFKDSPSVDKRHLVSEAGAGVVLGFGQFRYPLYMAFSFIWRDREFDLQQGNNNFGSAQIGIHY